MKNLTNIEKKMCFEKIKRGETVSLLNYRAIELVKFIYENEGGILPVVIEKTVYETTFKKR